MKLAFQIFWIAKNYIANLSRVETTIVAEIYIISNIINKINKMLIEKEREIKLVWRIMTYMICLLYKLYIWVLIFF